MRDRPLAEDARGADPGLHLLHIELEIVQQVFPGFATCPVSDKAVVIINRR